MVDLFPQPHDQEAQDRPLPSRPRRDPTPDGRQARKDWAPWPHISQAKLESVIHFISRWSGPAVLVAALLLIGWWLLG